MIHLGPNFRRDPPLQPPHSKWVFSLPSKSRLTNRGLVTSTPPRVTQTLPLAQASQLFRRPQGGPTGIQALGSGWFLPISTPRSSLRCSHFPGTWDPLVRCARATNGAGSWPSLSPQQEGEVRCRGSGGGGQCPGPVPPTRLSRQQSLAPDSSGRTGGQRAGLPDKRPQGAWQARGPGGRSELSAASQLLPSVQCCPSTSVRGFDATGFCSHLLGDPGQGARVSEPIPPRETPGLQSDPIVLGRNVRF